MNLDPTRLNYLTRENYKRIKSASKTHLSINLDKIKNAKYQITAKQATITYNGFINETQESAIQLSLQMLTVYLKGQCKYLTKVSQSMLENNLFLTILLVTQCSNLTRYHLLQKRTKFYIFSITKCQSKQYHHGA